MAFSLRITGGEPGTIDLNGATFSVAKPGWRPAVASRRMNPVGGWPYNDVDETLPINIVGDSKTAVLTALHELATIVEQGHRWLDNENVSPPLLEYDPDGGSSYVKAVIKGGARVPLDLPITFRPYLEDFVCGPVNVNARRLGAWLGAVESVSSGSSLTKGWSKTNATFSTDVAAYSPCDVTFTAVVESAPGAGVPTLYTDFYFVMVEDADDVEIHDFTGNYERFAATTTAGSTTRTLAGTVDARNVALYVLGDFPADCELWAEISVDGDTFVSPTKRTTPSSGTQVITLGLAAGATGNVEKVKIYYRMLTGSDDIDLSRLAVVDVSKTGNRAIRYDGDFNGQAATFEHRMNDRPFGLFYNTPPSGDTLTGSGGYRGVLPIVSKGTNLTWCVFDAGVGADFRNYDFGTGTYYGYTFDVDRTAAYLVPQ
jgi:hypothetical protein